MKTILCYGDSNTWGVDPDAVNPATDILPRHPYHVRWTGRIASILGDGFRVIEEGFNGRTTVFEDPSRPGRSAVPHLPVSFFSHEPLDLVTIMLGINDVKDVFSAQAGVIGWGMSRLLRELRYIIPSSLSPNVKLLLICPPALEKMANGEYHTGFSEASRQKTLLLPGVYEKVAEKFGCGYLNAAPLVTASGVDGIHFDAAAHAVLAQAIAAKIKEMLPPGA